MTVETTIYTVRHAHTEYNAQKRYAGAIDVPLSEEGIRGARQASAKLGEARFDVVITSTLRRAIQTAQLLVGEGVPTVQSELCNERNYGVFEGLTWPEVQKLEPPVLFIEVGNDLHSVNPPGGSHQGSITVNVLGIDLSPLLKERLHDLPVTLVGGPHQGGPTGIGLDIDLSPLLKEGLHDLYVALR